MEEINKIANGFSLVNPTDMFDDMLEYSHKGALKGVYLGFPNIHKHYSMSLPGVTDWTGFPTSGKSQILMEVLLNTSLYYGWKHLIYMPDVGNDVEIISDLIHKKTGKSFDNKYPNHITDIEIANELPWIKEHFIILTKNDLKAKITPYQFWEIAIDLKRKKGLQTASIDSWKDMRHDTSKFGRDDKYLEDVLSYRNSIAERYSLHLHTVIHPTRTDKDSNGHRKPPTPYDLKGGTEWFNNGKCMITVHRNPDLFNKTEIFFNKIKPRSIGEQGSTELHFDIEKFVYYNEVNGKRVYAEQEYKDLEDPVLYSSFDQKNDTYNHLQYNQEEIPF
jgi:hypothetical protein